MVEGEAYNWLADYLDAVGRTWQATGITKPLVARLLPDQHGKLRDFDELRRDGGVSDRLKTIATDVGVDMKAHLLDEALFQALTERGLEAGLYTIRESTGNPLSEEGRPSRSRGTPR